MLHLVRCVQWDNLSGDFAQQAPPSVHLPSADPQLALQERRFVGAPELQFGGQETDKARTVTCRWRMICSRAYMGRLHNWPPNCRPACSEQRARAPTGGQQVAGARGDASRIGIPSRPKLFVSRDCCVTCARTICSGSGAGSGSGLKQSRHSDRPSEPPAARLMIGLGAIGSRQQLPVAHVVITRPLHTGTAHRRRRRLQIGTAAAYDAQSGRSRSKSQPILSRPVVRQPTRLQRRNR